MTPTVGPLELAIVLVIALMLVGPKKLPDLARSAGRGVRELRTALGGDDGESGKSEEESTA